MTIIVAEDDFLLKKLLLTFLKNSGHEARSASDGNELVKLALESRPDLIFTDLHMPNMNGQTMIAMMDLYPDLSGIPVIVITGATEQEIKDMGLSRDIPVMFKPLDFNKISQELERVAKKLKP